MAKYTIELRRIQAEFFNAMQDYPIFDESYREKLNNKIYNALKYREIGYETIEMFIDMLKQWMDLNMPRYNWLYKSNLIELTPLQRAKIIEIFDGSNSMEEQGNIDKIENILKSGSTNEKVDNTGNINNNSSSNNTSNTESNNTGNSKSTGNETSKDGSLSYHSDFPQANLTEKEDSNYYTYSDKSDSNGVTDSTDTTESSSHETGSSTVNNTSESKEQSTNTTDRNVSERNSENSTGKEISKNKQNKLDHSMRERTGNEAKTDFELLDEYRKAFLNVDAKLIRALKRELFMNIW